MNVMLSDQINPKKLSLRLQDEHLYAVITCIGHIDMTCIVQGDATWTIKLPFAVTKLTPLDQSSSASIEHLYLVVALVSHVEVTTGVHGQTHRTAE